MSHGVVSGLLSSKTPEGTCRKAFICHDLIPVLHPEYAIDAEHVSRFRSHYTVMLQTGALALCTSNTSRGMLECFIGDLDHADVMTANFPVPSLLYAKASSIGRVHRFTPEKPFILYCSTIEARKNHLMLVEIWKEARNSGVALPKLVCAGKWGWGVDKLSEYLGRHPDISDVVQFAGQVSEGELIDLYRSALFCVIPSKVEGWGFGAAESLDFGVPAIVSTTPALSEAVQGLMPAIDPDDKGNWYKMIRLLAEDENERNQLIAKIEQHYRRVSPAESWAAIKSACEDYSRLQPASGAA
jgi:glycosyltransferase involved in cell wall biosynthesis